MNSYANWDFKDFEECSQQKITIDPSNPNTIPKFIDPLPIPKMAEPVLPCNNTKNNEIMYNISMVESKHRFHKNFPLTKVWGYNGSYPGPTIEVPKDVHIKVKWEKQITQKSPISSRSYVTWNNGYSRRKNGRSFAWC